MHNETKLVIGIAGGSGSGKTTLANQIAAELGSGKSEVLLQDRYFFDQSDQFDQDGGKVNFDHPDSIDSKCLANHISSLKSGRDTELPRYDFVTHTRSKESDRLSPPEILLVDGILILHYEEVRKLLDFSIFVDTPESVRFDRRLKRDVEVRGREPEGVKRQFENQVTPMHNQFVQPSKEFADVVVTNDDYSEALAKVRALRDKL